MSFTKCANGHIYDPDIYSSCPYCSGRQVEVNFDNKGKTEPVDQAAFPQPGVPQNMSNMGQTIPLDYPGSQDTAPVPNPFDPGQNINPRGWDADPSNGPARGRGDAGGGTEVIGGSYGIIPVSGWLVCLKGPMRGKSYTLYCKQNTIGRDRNKDAVITGDNTISGYQAIIAYDIRGNTFTIVPKTETNTMYVNNEPVYESTKIKPYDLIEMGRSTFVFVPFCGDRFTWEK